MDEPLDVWMVFHVVAATEEAATESLQDHIDSLRSEDCIVSMSAEMEEVEEVENPHESLDKGYSQVCEVEMAVDSFARLIDLVLNYGPTSVDVQSGDDVTMEASELRDALNSVAQMMHRFLQSGAGGMMISRNE